MLQNYHNAELLLQAAQWKQIIGTSGINHLTEVLEF